MPEPDEQTTAGRFRIVREDLQLDPAELITDGLKIGRLPTCELVLNHPSVSRLHAGINETDGRFYFYNFSLSSGTTLNGRVVPTETAEVLADGDVLQIGPFFLYVGRDGDELSLRVTLEVAVNVGDAEARTPDAPPEPDAQREAADKTLETAEVSQALNVFWEKRKREAGKMQRGSPLRPQKPMRVLGKARFNWTPTRDLVRPWTFSIFVWGTVAVALFSVVAAVVYAGAYSPAPISDAHARAAIRSTPAIARFPNSNSCTACHTLTGSVESKCASCHTAEGFKATVTSAHAAAGVGCTSCHVEHQGTEARPATASLQTCTACHTDANRKTFNGRRVSTPHGGTFGYPVAGGKWVWSGLTPEEWAQKSPGARRIVEGVEASLKRSPGERDPSDVLRSAEFHALHIHRVKAPAGFESNSEGEVSCSTCHQSTAPIDRDTPRTTCAACHSGDRGGKFERVLAADKPNCISCHVQHPQSRREWGQQLLAQQP
ncbi:MAG TPA: FHA domain-containing protein [Pyrinomonadaceae bacterium]|jgi:pSer/pThr/pTyr-binding forkhead associated (FHA) protein|nr:FHA domain-containing protein [Pyrinomonadaceae bacterium]